MIRFRQEICRSKPSQERRFHSSSAVLLILLGSCLAPFAASSRESSLVATSVDRVSTPDPMVQEINDLIRKGWTDNNVEPSPVADDAEWLRRVTLDINGHIPALDDVETFLADKDKLKRSKLIDRLLEDPAYVRHWTTIWSNLCIGQKTPRRVSRGGMQKFFRDAFRKNRPWNEVVFDLVAAEGHYEHSGAVNFLLAQMQDQDDGVQMTAKTTRLFLGMQVQCTQCHDHPFNKFKQDQFWQFNSFFKQTAKIDHRKYNPATGRMDEDFSEIVERDYAGPVYFEKRNGLMQVAYPNYFGIEVDPADSIERRKELAKLMIAGQKPLVAVAFVNRMWCHFFGYGFTHPIDDWGIHNPPSNPELAERLATEFVTSGYDCRRLIRWITNTEAYHLTSSRTKKNEQDNPAAGEPALFSHPSVKAMTAEQLYDSLIVATNAHRSTRTGWENSEQQRQKWLQQFIREFGTDDGEESNSFDGTIPQALMMMNGELVNEACRLQEGSHLFELLSQKGNDLQKTKRLFLTVLGRPPTKIELKKIQLCLKGASDQRTVFQDVFWALLNSNEFIFNH
ncbi:MAG: DUF1549 and DUF1553 domain-containing protein [Planctomycetales bacterium]|nr:DUF1549 and DUF1553 domain-containing protein [Planctomycetales bacterium]